MSISVKDKIRDIKDFPKKGIIFRDITTVIKDADAFKYVIDYFYDMFKDDKIDYVAAIESRGYIFGAPLAYKLDAGFIVIRKPGKLPAEVERVSYDLEYGTDSLEIHKDAIEPGKRVLLVDDLLATGGTICASCQLIEKLGGKTAGIAFMIELSDLNGREKLPEDAKIVTMVTY